MSELTLLLILLVSPDNRPQGPTREMVQEWLRTHDSAPPASWYPNGDPWRNPTAKELEKLEL